MKTIKLSETVSEMIESLKEAAEDCAVNLEDIRKLFSDCRINDLDELFKDGGEVRCEQFGDLAIDYALQYGDIETPPFNEAHWCALGRAMKEF